MDILRGKTPLEVIVRQCQSYTTPRINYESHSYDTEGWHCLITIPKIVRKEIYAFLLAYNILRTKFKQFIAWIILLKYIELFQF